MTKADSNRENQQPKNETHEPTDMDLACLGLSELIILSLNPDGVVVDINDKGVQMLDGETKTDIVGLNWFDRFLPQPEGADLKKIFFQIIHDKEFDFSPFETYENPIMTLSGQKRTIRWQNRVIKDENGGAIMVIAAGHDITDLSSARSKLQASEQKFKRMIETAHDITIEASLDGTITYASPQVRIFGYEPAEMEGRNFLEFVHEGHHAKVIEDFKYLLEHPEKIDEMRIEEAQGKAKDGTLIWFSINSGVITDGKGKPVGLTSVLRNIQESKLAQEKIEQERNKYETIFKNAIDGFVTLSREKFLDCNPAALGMLGMKSRSELMGKHPADISPPTQPNGASSREEADRRIEEGFKFGKISFDWVHKRTDGALINCIIQLNRIIMDDQVVLHGTMRDITEELKKTKRLAESENLYRTLVESNPYYIKLVTKDKQLVSMNSTALKLHGYDSVEEAKKSEAGGSEMFCEDTSEEARKAIKKAVNGETITANLNILDKESVPKPHRVTFAPIKNASGEITDVLIIGSDVSKQKALEKKVTELDQTKSQLTTGLTRLLKNPLNKIDWALEILLSGEASQLTDNQRMFVKQALQSNDEMLEVVNSINLALDIERGSMHVEKATSSLKGVVQSVMQRFNNRISLEKIRFTLKEPDDQIEMQIDRPKLEAAISSLIDNSIRYMRDDEKRIEITIKSNDVDVIFEIKDTGIGIPAGERQHVFTLFQRASNAFSKHPEGLGIGLYNAESVIKAHGGDIGFASEEGHGSTFWFRLPKN